MVKERSAGGHDGVLPPHLCLIGPLPNSDHRTKQPRSFKRNTGKKWGS